MEWQDVIVVLIVGVTAVLLVRAKLRRRPAAPHAGCAAGCACPHAAPPGPRPAPQQASHRS